MEEFDLWHSFHFNFIFRNVKCAHAKFPDLVALKQSQWLFSLLICISFHTWRRVILYLTPFLLYVNLSTFDSFIKRISKNCFKIHDFGEIEVRNPNLSVEFCSEIDPCDPCQKIIYDVPQIWIHKIMCTLLFSLNGDW